jgi:hypothetical protein
MMASEKAPPAISALVSTDYVTRLRAFLGKQADALGLSDIGQKLANLQPLTEHALESMYRRVENVKSTVAASARRSGKSTLVILSTLAAGLGVLLAYRHMRRYMHRKSLHPASSRGRVANTNGRRAPSSQSSTAARQVKHVPSRRGRTHSPARRGTM